MIKVNNLSYEYKDKVALREVDFVIEKGSISALVGPNGAGKTTLMRCIAALQKPMSGTILIDGVDILSDPHYAHRNIGYLSDFFGLYDDLTVRESLQFMAFSRIADPTQAIEHVTWAIQTSGVIDFVDKEINTLSRGMRQRVGIAQAIIHKPKVLILDEPASGLDPEARYALSKLLINLNSLGITILVSSHILAELEDYSTEMLVLHDGKVAEIRGMKQQDQAIITFKVVLAELPLTLVDQLKNTAAIKLIEQEGNTLFISFNEFELNRKDVVKLLLNLGAEPIEFGEHKINMQDEYIRTINQQKNNR